MKILASLILIFSSFVISNNNSQTNMYLSKKSTKFLCSSDIEYEVITTKNFSQVYRIVKNDSKSEIIHGSKSHYYYVKFAVKKIEEEGLKIIGKSTSKSTTSKI